MDTFQCRFHNARSAHTHIDDPVCLCHTMECAGHKWIVIGRIAEYDQLGTAQRILFLRQLRRLFEYLPHQTDCIHIDPGPRGTEIDRCADQFSLGQSLWNGADQKFLGRCHSLGNQG